VCLSVVELWQVYGSSRKGVTKRTRRGATVFLLRGKFCD
jgi:hypothetical protein